MLVNFCDVQSALNCFEVISVLYFCTHNDVYRFCITSAWHSGAVVDLRFHLSVLRSVGFILHTTFYFLLFK